jgi:hypothetical protein
MPYVNLSTIQTPTTSNFPLASWGAQVNENMTTMFPQLQNGWTTYTPSLTNAATVTSQQGRFRRQGHTIHFATMHQFAAGTTFSGIVRVALPAASDSASSFLWSGPAYIIDGVTVLHICASWTTFGDASSVQISMPTAGGTSGQFGRNGASYNPSLMNNTNSYLFLSGTYRAATATANTLA